MTRERRQLLTALGLERALSLRRGNVERGNGVPLATPQDHGSRRDP